MKKQNVDDGVPAKKRSRAYAVASLRSPKTAEPRASARSRARALADKHAKLMRRGWCQIYARDLRPMEWVQLPHFHLRVDKVDASGPTVYVRFQADHLPLRWWPRNYRLRVNYPRVSDHASTHNSTAR